jgi:hypothetical protein
VQLDDLIPAFKKVGVNGLALIELMHLQRISPDYMRKALMEHLGVGEYGRVLSFSTYVYLREKRPQSLIRFA